MRTHVYNSDQVITRFPISHSFYVLTYLIFSSTQIVPSDCNKKINPTSGRYVISCDGAQLWTSPFEPSAIRTVPWRTVTIDLPVSDEQGTAFKVISFWAPCFSLYKVLPELCFIFSCYPVLLSLFKLFVLSISTKLTSLCMYFLYCQIDWLLVALAWLFTIPNSPHSACVKQADAGQGLSAVLCHNRELWSSPNSGLTASAQWKTALVQLEFGASEAELAYKVWLGPDVCAFVSSPSPQGGHRIYCLMFRVIYQLFMLTVANVVNQLHFPVYWCIIHDVGMSPGEFMWDNPPTFSISKPNQDTSAHLHFVHFS